MKILLLVLCAFVIETKCEAQILKKLGKELESDARWKVRMKANKKMDDALDTVLAQPKKVLDKKKSKNDQPPDDQQPNKSSDKQRQNSKQTADINTSSKKDEGGSMDVS